MTSPHARPGSAGVLIVSASAGTGHVSAGRAIEDAVRRRRPDLDVLHVDILDLTSPVVRVAYAGGFELVASRAPWLWRQLYQRTDGDIDPARWGGPAERLLFRRFRSLLDSRRWSVVVSTHFLPSQLAAGRVGVPFAMVVTDFTLHRYWAQPRVRRYFVATDELAGQLGRRVPSARIEATGIPVRPAFAEAPAREPARRALGLEPDAPVVLVMGGGMGVGVDSSAAAVLEAGTPAQVVAVCGRNGDARARLEAMGHSPRRLRVMGLADDVPALMAAADVVVTKPGGLTVSEALAVGRPLVMTAAFPGQEEGNARTVVAAGAGLYSPSCRGLGDAVRSVLGAPARLREMEAAAKRLGRPDSADAVAASVLREFALADIA